MKLENKKEYELNIQSMLSREGIYFSNNEHGWKLFVEHIAIHQYHVNREFSIAASWEDAVFSWYENIYSPLMQNIQRWEVKNSFPNKAIGDIYLGISDHWLYLKEENSQVSAEDAVKSFVEHYGNSFGRFFSRFLL